MSTPFVKYQELKIALHQLNSRRQELLDLAISSDETEYQRVCNELQELAGNLRQSTGNYMPDPINEQIRQNWLTVKGDADDIFKDLLKNRFQDWQDAMNKKRL